MSLKENLGRPFVIVKGLLTEENDFSYQVNRRGFIVERFESAPAGAKHLGDAVLSFSNRLQVKLAVQAGCNIGENTHKSNATALEVLKRSPVKFDAAWIAHDKEILESILKSSDSQNLMQIAPYFGSSISFYGEWLCFYSTYLILPAIAGGALYTWQRMTGEIDTYLNPFFNILICFWGTIFVESWKRRSNELSHVWGVDNCEDDMIADDLKQVRKQK